MSGKKFFFIYFKNTPRIHSILTETLQLEGPDFLRIASFGL